MIDTAVSIIIGLSTVILAVAAVLTLIRATKGPTGLDRMVASDVMVGIVIAGLALEAALRGHTDTFPVMLVLSLVGFVGAVSMARFIVDRVDQPDASRDDEDPAGGTQG